MKKNNELSGKEYWRSLDQLADTPEFQEFLHREFPEDASEMKNQLSRRKFLTLMGASMAFAGLAGCRKPVEKIIPYVTAPEDIIPGIPKYYASTMPLGLHNYGILVESHEGRPTKIEGNEKHPSSLGKTNAVIQASILGLYDPDRSSKVVFQGQEKKWNTFLSFWKKEQKKYAENGGEGLAVLSESTASPTISSLYKQFRKTYPKAQWYVYQPDSEENIFKGMHEISGKNHQPVYHYEKAKVILSIDADFLLTEQESITANLGFASGRRVETEKDDMNRLYAVESMLTNTGAAADHRLRLPASGIPSFVVALAGKLKELGLQVHIPENVTARAETVVDTKWLTAVAKDLLRQKGTGLIVVGKDHASWVHALVHYLNELLENNGTTVTYHLNNYALLPDQNAIYEMKEAVQNKAISTLIILNGNPVYNSPGDLNFTELLGQISTTVHLSEYLDETSKEVMWHLPCTHFLESWGDAAAIDGTLSVIQPLIQPLFNGKSTIEFLNILISGELKNGYDLVRETWRRILSQTGFQNKWKKILHDGLLEKRASAVSAFKTDIRKLESLLQSYKATASVGKDNMEVVFKTSPYVYDGRFANNGWLQELPDPVTKLTWDNAAIFSPLTAKQLNLQNEDVVELILRNRRLTLPVWIVPGQADYSISVYLGYGRRAGGRIGTHTGVNAYRLRSSKGLYVDRGVSVFKTTEQYPLANTQDHGSMEGRPLVREATLEEYRKHPDFAPEMVEHPPLVSLWEEHSYEEGYQWGMTIDLNACTGCNACTLACQSENNIPVIGKEQVRDGREMHWIRMDRYYSGNLQDPQVVFQPVACVHCENAPCEQVCPVAATSHDEEGLNVMTYNRCIGTRYCANNCPYKVRRFNFFNFTKDYPEILKLAQNPDVTVRSRGVMEKCTYCTQRINHARISAKNEGRELKDGEVMTACQQACPANAIVFGNLNDPGSEISRMKKQNRGYAMLSELNLKPRTTYLAKLRNPNPELES